MLRTADACRAGRGIFLRHSDCRLLRHKAFIAGHAPCRCGFGRRAGFIDIIDRADNFNGNCAEHIHYRSCKT